MSTQRPLGTTAHGSSQAWRSKPAIVYDSLTPSQGGSLVHLGVVSARIFRVRSMHAGITFSRRTYIFYSSPAASFAERSAFDLHASRRHGHAHSNGNGAAAKGLAIIARGIGNLDTPLLMCSPAFYILNPEAHLGDVHFEPHLLLRHHLLSYLPPVAAPVYLVGQAFVVFNPRAPLIHRIIIRNSLSLSAKTPTTNVQGMACPQRGW